MGVFEYKFDEYKFDKDGKELHRVLEDKELMDFKIYAKICPALYAEIESQYGDNKNHFYYLSEEAQVQYQQIRHGIVFNIKK